MFSNQFYHSHDIQRNNGRNGFVKNEKFMFDLSTRTC